MEAYANSKCIYVNNAVSSKEFQTAFQEALFQFSFLYHRIPACYASKTYVI